MEQVYSQSAVSITVTSLTTVLSFAIGISSTVPAVRISCIYGSCCCLFAYVYLLTFFGGCMALSGYREERRLHPFTFRRIRDKLPKEEPTLHFVMLLFSRIFGPFFLRKSFKILIGVIFTVLLAVGIKGIYGINTVFLASDGLKFDSPNQQVFTVIHKYFGKYTSPVHIIIKDCLNYADPSVQKTIEELMNNFTSYEHIAEPLLEMSWLKHYKMFQNITAGKLMLSSFNMSDEKDFVYALKEIFLKIPLTRPYVDDVRFNEDGTKILSSRFILLTKDVYTPETETVMIKDLYNIADQSQIPIEIFSISFHLIESSLTVPKSTSEIAAICCSIVCAVFILFAPNIPYALCISGVVLCSIVQVIGLVSFCNVNLDYVTLICFSYSIGLCINYPSHMAFAILMGKRNSNDRTRDAFYLLAYPITQGCLTTVLGLLCAALHLHYVSQSVFKIISIISLLSTFHGLFTIPVLLSIIENVFTLTPARRSDLPIETVEQNTLGKNLLVEEDENKI